MIKILIVDDHMLVRRGLKETIDDSGLMRVEDEAKTGIEALEKIRSKDFDVVLLDINMPGMDGIEVLREIKATKGKIGVIMLSIYPEERFAVRAFKAGASAYLTKDAEQGELFEAITKAHNGKKHVSPELAEHLAAVVSGSQDMPPSELLSDREFSVLVQIAKGKNLTEIADQMKLAPTTVSTYRSRILDKTGLHSNAEIVQYTINHGLLE